MTLLWALARDERANAAAGWLCLGVVALGAVDSLLTDALLWGVFAATVVVVAALPAGWTGEWTAFVPWPLALTAAAATSLRALEAYPEAAGHLGVAALALVVAVEIDAFTSVEMSRGFAVGFAVLTAMALQGVWTVAQFYSDQWLGTAFLRSQVELQWDLVGASVTGAALGVVFAWYFDRVDHVGARGRRRPGADSR